MRRNFESGLGLAIFQLCTGNYNLLTSVGLYLQLLIWQKILVCEAALLHLQGLIHVNSITHGRYVRKGEDLQLQVEAFISSFSHDHGDTDEQQVHRTYDHLTRQLTELTQSVSHELQSEESNDLSERLQNLGSILTGTYHQRCNEISNTHLESHNKSPDIQPHDSASNVGSGLSKASSRTPSQLARQQIDLELERQKLELQYQLRKAELTIKEKRLALSNPGSLISRHCPVPVRASASFTDFGNRDVRTTALKRNLQTTFASNLEQHASMEATSRNSGSAAKENTSVACGIGLPLCDSAEQSFPIADHVGGSSHSNCAPPETTQSAPPHPQQNLHYLTDTLPQLPAFELPDEAQQTFRGQHQPLQRHNLHHDTPRTRDYVENHVHSGATHANKALETSTILEIPMALIHEQNRKTPSQDHFAQPQNYNNAAQRTFHRDSTNLTRASDITTFAICSSIINTTAPQAASLQPRRWRFFGQQSQLPIVVRRGS